STPETRQLLTQFSADFKHPIIHVWHDDDGFQKSKILNKAILQASSDYLLFTDGDCIPRKDFIAVHLKHKEKGYFLSGGYFKLPMEISQSVTDIDIKSQKCFHVKFLRQ